LRLRIFASAINLALIVFIAWNLIANRNDNGAIAIVLLVLAVPIINIVALWTTGANDWIALYFERKAMEEKNRIAELHNQRKP
jgi:hypothetical protein